MRKRMTEAALWLPRGAVWLADEALDRVPAREDGRWYRYGGWGCRLRLSRFWWPEEGR